MLKRTCRELENLSVHLAEEYYKGNMEEVMKYMHPDIAFLSVGKGQLVNGLGNIKEAFAKRVESGIRYEILAMNCQSFSYMENNCYVILQMELFSYYPNDTVKKVNQRISIMWIKKQELQCWYMATIHASIAIKMNKKTELLPHISEELFREATGLAQQEELLGCRGTDRKIHYLTRAQIMWIESNKVRCTIHQVDGELIIVYKSLHDYEQELGERFVRIHNSYIVNATYVKDIKNYMVTMRDGSKLRVSRGRYAEIKGMLGTVMGSRSQ